MGFCALSHQEIKIDVWKYIQTIIIGQYAVCGLLWIAKGVHIALALALKPPRCTPSPNWGKQTGVNTLHVDGLVRLTGLTQALYKSHTQGGGGGVVVFNETPTVIIS